MTGPPGILSFNRRVRAWSKLAMAARQSRALVHARYWASAAANSGGIVPGIASAAWPDKIVVARNIDGVAVEEFRFRTVLAPVPEQDRFAVGLPETPFDRCRRGLEGVAQA